MAFPSLPPLQPSGIAGSSSTFSCQGAGLLLLLSPVHLHEVEVGTLGDATISVEPGMDRGLWAPGTAQQLAGMVAWLGEG